MRIVEFADFQCPFCQANHSELLAFLTVHPGVGVVYRHLPLPQHPAAEAAAKAAICAEHQGVFRAFHHYLFETANWQEDRNWSDVAQATNVGDLAEFERCLDTPATAARLEADKELAKALGITGTPAFVTERHVVQGLQTDLAGLLAMKR